MRDQSSKGGGELASTRQLHNTTPAESDSSLISSNRTTGGFGNTGCNVSSDSGNLNGLRTTSNGSSTGDKGPGESLSFKDRLGNKGQTPRKMPLKLVPHFGKDPSLRVGKWNKAVERQLKQNVETMSQKLKSKTFKIDQGIFDIEKQLKDLDLELSKNTVSSLDSSNEEDEKYMVKFPAIPSSRRHISRRHGSGKKCSYDSLRSKCRCHHFPCVRPHTYHTIGYRGNPDFTPWMSWEDIKESWNAPELVDNVSTCPHDVKVSPRMLTLRREEKLRKTIERRKQVNDTRRPRSWVTNYGQPMSYKQLKYPVRLYSITN